MASCLNCQTSISDSFVYCTHECSAAFSRLHTGLPKILPDQVNPQQARRVRGFVQGFLEHEAEERGSPSVT